MAINGIPELMGALDEIAGLVSSDEIVQAANASWSIVRDAIEDNARSEGYFDTGLLLDPRSIISFSGMTTGAEGVVYAEAGVFKDDSAMISFGLDPKKDMPRSMVAYWLEFGTQEHYVSKGVRARKVPVSSANTTSLAETGDAGKTAGITPSYFMTRAYETSHEMAFNDFRTRLSFMIEKAWGKK